MPLVNKQQEPIQFLQLAQTDALSDSLNQGLYMEQEKTLDVKQESQPVTEKVESKKPEKEDKKESISSQTSIGEKPGKIGQKSAKKSTEEPSVDEKSEEKDANEGVVNKLAQTVSSTASLKEVSDTTLDHLKFASKRMATFLSQVSRNDASTPVKEAHALFLFVFSIASIVGCCASTTVCVRAARDSNIAMNAMNIRRKYQRNMQLYMLLKEKKLIDNQLEKAARGDQSQSMLTSDQSQTMDDDESSSFITDSQDNSQSYISHANMGATNDLIHQNDQILERSNEDDDSFVDRRQRRRLDPFGMDSENISLIDDDYVIVDPITEHYRNQMQLQHSATNANRRSFFDENLQSQENLALTSPSPRRDFQSDSSGQPSEGGSAEPAHVHVSHLAAGLTDCDEDDEEDADDSNQNEDDNDRHFNVDPVLREDQD